MAGDWIKLESVTPDKPEVHRIAELLGIDPDAVLGKLCRVWIWADQQTTNGNALSVTRALLDRITLRDGFATALLHPDVKWLVQDDSGAIHFPNFDRHNGATAKARALGNKRQKKCRNASRDCHADNVTVALPEKRRVEKKTPLPPFESEAFKEAWRRWEAYRTEIKKPLPATTVSLQFSMLAKLGEAKAIESIDNSVRNRWSGLFEPSTPNAQQPTLPTQRDGLALGQKHYESTPLQIQGVP